MGDLLCAQLASYPERGLLMWIMPLHLYANQKSDDDDDDDDDVDDDDDDDDDDHDLLHKLHKTCSFLHAHYTET